MRCSAVASVVFGVLLLLAQPAGAAIIEEISVDSIDTVFNYVANPLTDSYFAAFQSGVTVVVEWPGNVQTSVSDASFLFMTQLQADNSIGDKAVGVFGGGAIVLRDVTGLLLLSADIQSFTLEENTLVPFCVLAGAGTFTVTGGAWQSHFLPEGIVFDLTWKLDQNIDSFSESFTAESDLTLTPIPEPAALSLLGLGAVMTVIRRRRS